MNNTTQTDDEIGSNGTLSSSERSSGTILTITVIHSVIASVGMVGNFTVIVAFLSHKKFRKKIPNIFIINQVSIILTTVVLFCVHLLE